LRTEIRSQRVNQVENSGGGEQDAQEMSQRGLVVSESYADNQSEHRNGSYKQC